MPRYEIEQYELHSTRYSVVAANEAEAIQKLLSGNVIPIDNSLELIEVCNDHGMPVGENQKLAAELRALGIEIGLKVIPSVRSIEEVE